MPVRLPELEEGVSHVVPMLCQESRGTHRGVCDKEQHMWGIPLKCFPEGGEDTLHVVARQEMAAPKCCGLAMEEVMLKRALPISKRTFPRVDLGVDQVKEALGMTASCKELCIPGLYGPWEGQPGGRVPYVHVQLQVELL